MQTRGELQRLKPDMQSHTMQYHQLIGLDDTPDVDVISVVEQSVTVRQEPYPVSDLGNAMRVLDLCGGILRYCSEAKQWYVYNNTCWEPKTSNQVAKLERKVLLLSYA